MVDRPVVKWWVPYGVFLVGLNQIVAVDSINDNISELQILISSVTMIMRWRWLVNGPVIEWWIPNWVFSVKLNIGSIFLTKVEFIWTNSDLVETKSSLSH